MTPLGLFPGQAYVVAYYGEDVIGTVLRTAENIRMPHRHGSFNPLFSLPEPTAKIKTSNKESYPNFRRCLDFADQLYGR
jgi:hypothetical protein